jgi:hypothetical protein
MSAETPSSEQFTTEELQEILKRAAVRPARAKAGCGERVVFSREEALSAAAEIPDVVRDDVDAAIAAIISRRFDSRRSQHGPDEVIVASGPGRFELTFWERRGLTVRLLLIGAAIFGLSVLLKMSAVWVADEFRAWRPGV